MSPGAVWTSFRRRPAGREIRPDFAIVRRGVAALDEPWTVVLDALRRDAAAIAPAEPEIIPDDVPAPLPQLGAQQGRARGH